MTDYFSWILVTTDGQIITSSEPDIQNKKNIKETDQLPYYIIVSIDEKNPKGLLNKYYTYFHHLRDFENRVIVQLKHSPADDFIKQLISHGISYIVEKDDLTIPQMIEMCNTYSSYLSTPFRAILLEAIQHNNTVVTTKIDGNGRKSRLVLNRHKAKSVLTNRELDVLECILHHGSNALQLAYALNITTSTVKNHKSHIISKLKADNLNHVISKCIRSGIINVVI